MRFEEKIATMLANGKLSSEEANLLKGSLSGSSRLVEVGSEYHQTLPVRTIFICLTALLIACLFLLSGGHQAADVQTIQNVSETLNQSGKVGEMNKSLSAVFSILLIGLPVIGSLIWFTMTYNGLVTKEEDVLSSWAQVEANYQRRADLVPNLVKTVKAFADHEGATLANVTELRAKADKIQTEVDNAMNATKGSAARLDDEASLDNVDKTQKQVDVQLRTMMTMVESYPTLKSSEQFLELQAQIEGTENRINVARMNFNEKVGEFNASIRRMPGSLAAGLGDFSRKAYFKSDAGAEKVVDVDLNNKDQHGE